MVSPEPRLISAPLMVAPLSIDAQFPEEADCLACGWSLVLHQPVDDAPLRLLGTCDRCGGWHLIDVDWAVVALLPDATAFGDAVAGR